MPRECRFAAGIEIHCANRHSRKERLGNSEAHEMAGLLLLVGMQSVPKEKYHPSGETKRPGRRFGRYCSSERAFMMYISRFAPVTPRSTASS